MTEQIMWMIIIGLLGIIIGGATGSAIFKGIAKKAGIDAHSVSENEVISYVESAKAAAHAAEAASEIAKVFRDTVSIQLTDLKDTLKIQSGKIDILSIKQIELVTSFNQFPRMCEERHKAIDSNIDRIELTLNKFSK